MIAFKVIKPTPLNLQASTQIKAQMLRSGNVIKQDFVRTTQGWKHKVEFTVAVAGRASATGQFAQVVGANVLELYVYTTSKIYAYVNQGTRPHEIWAGIYTGKSDKKALTIFESTPQTHPGSLASGGGTKGELIRLTPYVQHPGTKARKFDEQITKKHFAWFMRDMQDAMRRAAAASGHYMG